MSGAYASSAHRLLTVYACQERGRFAASWCGLLRERDQRASTRVSLFGWMLIALRGCRSEMVKIDSSIDPVGARDADMVATAVQAERLGFDGVILIDELCDYTGKRGVTSRGRC